MGRKINRAGLELLKRFEGRRLVAYQDVAGIWSVGYGHTGPEVIKGLSITAEEADKLLEIDLEKYEHIDQYLSEQVNDNQWSALVVLTYNIGLRALKLSTLIKKINAGEKPDKEWMKFVYAHVNGEAKVIPGLVARREAELQLYNRLG